MSAKLLSDFLPLEMASLADLSKPFPLLAIASAACVLVFLAVWTVAGRGRKDAPPVVEGNVPIFGHFFLFLKSPLDLVSEPALRWRQKAGGRSIDRSSDVCVLSRASLRPSHGPHVQTTHPHRSATPTGTTGRSSRSTSSPRR